MTIECIHANANVATKCQNHFKVYCTESTSRTVAQLYKLRTTQAQGQ